MTDWFEKLPGKCPPDNAFSPEGFTFYRLSNSEKPTESDFLSQRALSPTSNFKGVSDCVALSLSVWDDINKCLNLTKLPRHKGKSVLLLKLKREDGLVLKTFKPNHFSWWRTKSFDFSTVEIIK